MDCDGGAISSNTDTVPSSEGVGSVGGSVEELERVLPISFPVTVPCSTASAASGASSIPAGLSASLPGGASLLCALDMDCDGGAVSSNTDTVPSSEGGGGVVGFGTVGVSFLASGCAVGESTKVCILVRADNVVCR